ncbi:hypothetical protein HK101_012040 [Irineochytrium annulatum]|nr:hypothetical protein HK101_012040 [Irineochytrium annulatum]
MLRTSTRSTVHLQRLLGPHPPCRRGPVAISLGSRPRSATTSTSATVPSPTTSPHSAPALSPADRAAQRGAAAASLKAILSSKSIPAPPHTLCATPLSAYSAKIYVFPTADPSRYALHVKPALPRNQFELVALLMAMALRKWRFMIVDRVKPGWMGLEKGPMGGLVKALNRWMTRRAEDEYFLKTVPMVTTDVEFIYPTSVNPIRVKQQLVDYLSSKFFHFVLLHGSWFALSTTNLDSARHRFQLFLWAIILPANILLAKIFFTLANIFLAYNVFRVNAHMRSFLSGGVLGRLLDKGNSSVSKSVVPLADAGAAGSEAAVSQNRRVTWTKSEKLEEMIRSHSADVTKELRARARPGEAVWERKDARDGGGDLHDLVVERLGKDLRLFELGRTYSRIRTQREILGR